MYSILFPAKKQVSKTMIARNLAQQHTKNYKDKLLKEYFPWLKFNFNLTIKENDGPSQSHLSLGIPEKESPFFAGNKQLWTGWEFGSIRQQTRGVTPN